MRNSQKAQAMHAECHPSVPYSWILKTTYLMHAIDHSGVLRLGVS